MNTLNSRVLRSGWPLAASCALSLLVACSPAGTAPNAGPSPAPSLSPSLGPNQPGATPTPDPGPDSPIPTPSGGSTGTTPTPNPAAGSSTSIRLPDGTRLVLTLPNRFLDGSGQSVRITAQLFDANGNPIPLGDLRLRFSSSRPELFSVNDQGLITALRDDGFSTITVSVDGTELSASQLISVFTATGGGSGGGGGGSQSPGDESLRLSAGFEGLGLGEFRVNTSTVSQQRRPDVDMDSDGDFVVVWQSADGSGYGIFARRYASTGLPQGPEFRVNYRSEGDQQLPVVSLDEDGDFVVAWQQNLYTDYDIYARRFSQSGIAQGPEFRVNTFNTSSQREPAIDSDADGDFTIVWTSYSQDTYGEGVFGQRFLASGMSNGNEFQLNDYFTNHQRNADIAMDSSGDFQVVWQSYSQEGYGYGIYGRRYVSNGTLALGEFHVNLTTTGSQVNPTIALDEDGSFLVAWDSNPNIGTYDIIGLRYQSIFTPLGEEFRVNSFTTGHQRNSQVSIDGDGDFVISWDSYGEYAAGSSNRAMYKRYAADGSPVAESQLNLYENATNAGTSARLRSPVLAGNSAGQFVIGWQSLQEGSGFGIYARLFDELGQAQ